MTIRRVQIAAWFRATAAPGCAECLARPTRLQASQGSRAVDSVGPPPAGQRAGFSEVTVTYGPWGGEEARLVRGVKPA